MGNFNDASRLVYSQAQLYYAATLADEKAMRDYQQSKALYDGDPSNLDKMKTSIKDGERYQNARRGYNHAVNTLKNSLGNHFQEHEIDELYNEFKIQAENFIKEEIGEREEIDPSNIKVQDVNASQDRGRTNGLGQ